MKYNYYQGAINNKRVSDLALLTIAALFITFSLTIAMLLPANARGNSLKSESVPAEVASVEAEVSDPAASNFEEEFTYYVVRFESIDDHEQWTYREPARLGGQNHEVAWRGSSDAFWFGVTAPDSESIQHEIEHKGQVNMYYETDDTTYSITAQFNGHGELLHVNGVQPQ